MHYAPRPALVLPHPLLTTDWAALADGPVLVGWDGSAGAQRALGTAEELFGARRIVIVAVHDGTPPSAPADPRMVVVERADGHLAAGRAVAEALGEQAAEQRAAAIVVGSRGRTALREILLGSVAMATLHHTPRPVLVVPHRARHGSGTGADRRVRTEESGQAHVPRG